MRFLLLDAIERAEVLIRTRIVNDHTLLHGAFGYLDRANLPGLQVHEHREMLDRIREEARRSRETFVTHFFSKYTSETDLPLWMACELMTFGSMFTLYRGLAKPLQQKLAAQFGVADTVFESWLRALNQARNLCAHHARVWNRVFGLRPQIPRANKHPQWHQPVAIRDDRLFGLLSVLRYLLRQAAPASHWPQRLIALLVAYHDIPTADMGFPVGWEQSPIWL
jgi:abortive infection bacteriophage resistance protein